jgi:aryl-alcohol dehydrogenase-like predicted oxidoreductase
VKLALGTVQFGLNYGIANQSGQVTRDEAAQILAVGSAAGIGTLDTAIAYGDSERVLGQIGVAAWTVVSKLPAMPEDLVDVHGWVMDQVTGSLKRLGVARLHALLLHRPDQLFSQQGPAFLGALSALKAEGLVDKIGVSIYEPDELERLFALTRFDLVQAPLSILDRRLVGSGWTTRLKSLGVELHTRSAFLQGLLLMRANERPEKFRRWNGIWETWSQWLGETGLSPLEACLRYPLSVAEVDKVIVGIDSVVQLREILAAASGPMASLPCWPGSADPVLLNPASWSK